MLFRQYEIDQEVNTKLIQHGYFYHNNNNYFKGYSFGLNATRENIALILFEVHNMRLKIIFYSKNMFVPGQNLQH